MLLALWQYATVKPYYGWWEIEHALRPYLSLSAIGLGFAAVILTHKAARRWWRRDRRKGRDRRREGRR